MSDFSKTGVKKKQTKLKQSPTAKNNEQTNKTPM